MPLRKMQQPKKSYKLHMNFEHHPVFSLFENLRSKGTGEHIFDFVGTATRVAYKRGWERFLVPVNRVVMPALPDRNEHYLDWIALLTAVSKARGVFRMAELGAGYAPWLVCGAVASRQCKDITALELMAVEADPIHFSWALQHFSDNGLDPSAHWLFEGAVSGSTTQVAFPAIDNPDEDYGAGLARVTDSTPTRNIPSYALDTLLAKFTGPLDFLHVDIQGEEYNTLPIFLPLLDQCVKSIAVGTHLSDAHHDQLAAAFQNAGWCPRLILSRNSEHALTWGNIKTDDGFLWLTNPRFG